MKPLLCTLLLAGLVVASTASGQPDPGPPGFLGYQQGIAPGSLLGDINQAVDSVWKPVLDGMVEEGLINGWGILTHGWGDEWNWNWYMATKDHHTFVTAWDTVFARIGGEGLGLLYNRLEAHKDNLYTMSHVKGRELAEGESPARFLMFNQHQVDLEDMERLNELTETVSKPILDAMVDEGKFDGWGVLSHSWADEWNWNWYVLAKDHASFVSAWGEMVQRTVDADPDAFTEFNRLSKRHRDNLYTVRYAR